MISKKIILSIVTLILLLGGVGAGVFIVRQNANFEEKAAPATVVSILPATQTKAPGDEVNFSVQLSTGTGESANKVTNFDLVLSYDPLVLEITSVEKGVFGQALDQELKKQIDNTSGRIAYSAYTLNKNSVLQGQGVLLKITGKVKPGATAKTVKLAVVEGSEFAGLAEGGQNLLTGSFPAEVTVTGGAGLGVPTQAPTPTPRPTPTPTQRPNASPSPTAGPSGGAATGSATIKPSATPTPKATAKPTSVPASGSATQSAVPVSGSITPTLLALSSGAVIFLLGIFLSLK